LIDELVAGTNLMLRNERPNRSLDDVFSDHFYPAIGLERLELQPEIDRFYDDVFPTLKEFGSARPEAVQLVDAAFARGWRVVVATNPVFPRKAVAERLRWANLPPEKYPFTWVSTMETSHFTKENPAYYLELLGNLGWPADPVLMAGDDPVRDIDSGLRAGLPVYWVRPEGKSLPELVDLPQGTLKDLGAWVENVNLELLEPNLKNPEALIHSLRATPAVLDSLVRTLEAGEWLKRAQPDEWALVEIVCHLRDLDVDVNLPRLQTLMTEDGAFIAGQDTDPWAAERQYIKQDGPTAFRDFVAARMRLIGMLKSLSREGWNRRGRHTIFGPTSLHELVGFMAEHDRTHIRQIATLMAGLGKAR
jgi:FMN phosphatase YigB (HAD superfamily)